MVGAIHHRARLNRAIRGFFEERDFVEVETPYVVPAAGTDPYIDPVEVRPARGAVAYLHTSPEFAMKEILVDGLPRIYQLCHVWRDGEHTPLHNSEFTLLEWYRALAGYHDIMDDVEALVRALLPAEVEVRVAGYEGVVDLSRPFRRITMQQAWIEACGIDPIASASDHAALCRAAGVERWERWDELFFDLMLERAEPWLKAQGAVFVTEWPTELAVLARRCAHDARVAERFELYVGGIELGNGFGELTDPVEQRARFQADNRERAALGKPPQPIPERFLAALERGLPASAGVALGVDRLLMLATGARTIGDVLA